MLIRGDTFSLYLNLSPITDNEIVLKSVKQLILQCGCVQKVINAPLKKSMKVTFNRDETKKFLDNQKITFSIITPRDEKYSSTTPLIINSITEQTKI